MAHGSHASRHSALRRPCARPWRPGTSLQASPAARQKPNGRQGYRAWGDLVYRLNRLRATSGVRSSTHAHNMPTAPARPGASTHDRHAIV